jgi:hypothetical protein
MIATCPNCHHQFSPARVMRDNAVEAWVWLVGSKTMTNKSYAASRDLSPTTVTLYRRLGICLIELGLDPVQDPVLWDWLANKSMALTDPRTRHAIEHRYPLQALRDLVTAEEKS